MTARVFFQSVQREAKSVELSVAFGRFFELYGSLKDVSVCFLIRIDKRRNTQIRVDFGTYLCALKTKEPQPMP